MSPRRRKRRPFGGVTKDPLDLRDAYYEGSLQELPFKIDNRRDVPIVLDQGEEGACTGFALAAVVNFLLCNRSDTKPPERRSLKKRENSASARMLYEMAKRYDEWKGEGYEGSSIRGAMKGWHKHGVCTWKEWPYAEGDEGSLTPTRQMAALRRPLGAYFRVRHSHLNQMQSALREAGILYASASVHEGWYEVNERTGKIPYRTQKAGGHAFAVVGYDREGFWIQNSWGRDWGLKGFCHISYDDWLENGYDCWVARLGVPTISLAMAGEVDRRRVSYFDHLPHESVVLSQIRPHFVNLGNDGALSSAGIYSNTEREVEEHVIGGFREKTKSWKKPVKLFLYAHGGLNGEKASASRIATLVPRFLANQIYPIHFMWESGLWDSIQGIIQDAFRKARFMGWAESLRERFYDLVDEAVELGAGPLGRPVWKEMKENARLASTRDEGGARFVAEKIAGLRNADPKMEVHLAGHSAGSIFHAHLASLLAGMGVPIKTLTLFAPACTTKLFKEEVFPLVGDGVQRLTIFNLTDEYEQDDSVTSMYNKSLLYLVSGALERKRNTPLLGMQKYLTKDRDLKKLLGAPVSRNESTVIYSKGGPASIILASQSKIHGGFDNDEDTLNSTMRIIRGRNPLDRPF